MGATTERPPHGTYDAVQAPLPPPRKRGEHATSRVLTAIANWLDAIRPNLDTGECHEGGKGDVRIENRRGWWGGGLLVQRCRDWSPPLGPLLLCSYPAARLAMGIFYDVRCGRCQTGLDLPACPMRRSALCFHTFGFAFVTGLVFSLFLILLLLCGFMAGFQICEISTRSPHRPPEFTGSHR